MNRILCIWLPNWPIQRQIAVQPELSGRPLVLYARDPRRGQQVVACSENARQRGVRVGMPLAEARSSRSRNASRTAKNLPPHTVTMPYDPQGDRRSLERLARWCDRYSPLVGLDDTSSKNARRTPACDEPQGLLIEVTFLGPLFGGEFAMAEQVIEDFRKLGYHARAAVADTIGAAWAVAHFGTFARDHAQGDEGESEGGSSRPIRVVWPGGHAAAIGPLPVAALRLPDETVELLEHLGVTRIDQLAHLPRGSLSSRLGAQPLWRLDQALGTVREVLVAQKTPVPFQVETRLEHASDDPGLIAEVLRQLVVRLSERLARQGQGAVQVDCVLQCQPRSFDVENHESMTGNRCCQRMVGLFEPTANSDHLFDLLWMQFSESRLPGFVERIRLRAGVTAALEQRQGEMFAGRRQATRPLALLVNRLSSRLGRECVVRPDLQPDPQPERAYRYIPLAGTRSARKPRRATGPAAAGAAPLPGVAQRPLELFAPPRRLDVVAVVPHGPPIRFQDGRRSFQIAHHWGPERIETGWWRGPSVRRDYYRVETTTGQRFWLFRCLRQGSWFLHGVYS